jgi:hypothetical protein
MRRGDALRMKRKTFVIICTLAILSVVLFVCEPFRDGNSGRSYFSWVTGNAKNSVVQVVTGKTVVVPFEFRAGSTVSEVRFEIKDESLWMNGIFLEDTVVPVRNGMASSRVLFNFQSGAGMKAGRYALTVIARDTVSGKIIREGEIPFAVDMLDLIWKCSC